METLSEKIMVVMGLAKCLLVALFFLSFGLIDPRGANAENADACDGVNLVEKIKSEKPQVYERLQEEAAAIENGQSVFWEIRKDGHPVSYLFGTMHMADPAIATLRDPVKKAIDASDRLVVEAVDALDPAASQKAMGQVAHLTLLQEGTLRDLVQDDLEDELEAALSKRGLPMMLADRMQPWLVATMISLPVCEIQRKQSGEKVLDSALAGYASETGKEVAGLETIVEQLSAMASLPQSYHVSALEETLANGSLGQDMIATLKAQYLKGEMGIVLPLMREMAPASFTGKGAAQFQEALLKKRNVLMAERMMPMLEQGSSFVAVGALHLQGETGLVKLLREKGYTVSPMGS